MFEDAFYLAFLVGVIVCIGWVISKILIALGSSDHTRRKPAKREPLTYPRITGTDEDAVWVNEYHDWGMVYVDFGDGSIAYMDTKTAKEIAVDARK